MSADVVHAHCLSLPGASHVVQWRGMHVFKVGSKMFAVMGPDRTNVTLKCAHQDMAELLVESGRAKWPPYLKMKSWVAIQIGDVPEDELHDRISVSYAVVRKSLTKAAQADLPPYERSDA
ncbi:MAG: MmcQ/YjbR family DNA-binding protein [Pseudomonadota bacterium]